MNVNERNPFCPKGVWKTSHPNYERVVVTKDGLHEYRASAEPKEGTAPFNHPLLLHTDAGEGGLKLVWGGLRSTKVTPDKIDWAKSGNFNGTWTRVKENAAEIPMFLNAFMFALLPQ